MMNWIKWTSKLPPFGERVLVAVKNNDGDVWNYDICIFWGGDASNTLNWAGKSVWGIPQYWMPISDLPSPSGTCDLKSI